MHVTVLLQYMHHALLFVYLEACMSLIAMYPICSCPWISYTQVIYRCYELSKGMYACYYTYFIYFERERVTVSVTYIGTCNTWMLLHARASFTVQECMHDEHVHMRQSICNLSKAYPNTLYGIPCWMA